MKIFGVAGWSGSGKTTLLSRLLPELIARGLTVSTIKHAHHNFDVDKPGKDSWLHREAGASEVMISSANRWALMHEHRGAPEPTIAELVRHMTPVDLLLVEGFKHAPHAKLEVHRASLGKPLLCEHDPYVVAVATMAPIADLRIPCLSLDEPAAIADFIIGHCRLAAGAKTTRDGTAQR